MKKNVKTSENPAITGESLASSEALPNDISVIEEQYRKEIAELHLEGGKKKSKKAETTTTMSDTSIESDMPRLEQEDLEQLISLPIDMYFERIKVEKLSNLEKKALAKSTADLLNKYMPRLGKWKEETAFLICVGSIIIKRHEFRKPKPELQKRDNSGIRPAGNGEEHIPLQ